MRFDENGKVVNWDFHMAAAIVRFRRRPLRRRRASRASHIARRSLRRANARTQRCQRPALRQVREPSAHGRVQISRRVQFLRFALARRTRGEASSPFRAGITRRASRLPRGCSAFPRRSSCRSTRQPSSSAATREYGAEIVFYEREQRESRGDRARASRRSAARRSCRRSTIRASLPAPEPRPWSLLRMPARSMRSWCRWAAVD